MSKITGIPPQLIARLNLPKLPEGYFFKFKPPKSDTMSCYYELSLCKEIPKKFLRRPYKRVYRDWFEAPGSSKLYGGACDESWQFNYEEAAKRLYLRYRRHLERRTLEQRLDDEFTQLWSV